MGAPPTLPAQTHARIAAAARDLPPTLTLIQDAFGGVVGAAKRIPPSVALPGGLTAVEVDAAAVGTIPVGDAVGRARIAVRWRGRCLRPEVVATADVVCVCGRIVGDGAGALGEAVAGGAGGAVDAEFFVDSRADDGDGLPVAPWCEDAGDGRGAALDVDVVGYLSGAATAAEVKGVMVEAIGRQISCARAVAGTECRVVVRHFAVLEDDLVVSVVRTEAEDGEDEDAAESIARRAREHDGLMLGMKRPLLRRARAVDFRSTGCGGASGRAARRDGGCEGRLADVHVGIRGHGLGEKAVSVHTVRGRYLYCHYMQDRFRDSGWGCAYRSLQTLMSWCASEGVTSFPGGVLPTHRAIQQALVDVGDKPGSFVGGREWIGANECCYALERLTGVASRILHVSRGSEMEGKGRELARHFDEQGSPVMVGGGVLAWTILGVARDSRTGKTMFLILDPHYEGADSLSVIQAKGWVAWKGADVFKANAFYNLCMPMRPTSV